ncbi:MAG: hypothetical protein HC851_17435 [Acaryochloris sp. RU_4_1]|nr:hypothetical protein [Acaryochloris sp. RU_4_1]
MSDTQRDELRLTVEPLDQKRREEWLKMSAQVIVANIEHRSVSKVNHELDVAAQSEPQSPLAPAYRLWIADNLAREAQYLEAVRAFDSAIDSAQSARRFLADVDPISASLLHKAQAAMLGKKAKIAISAYQELAQISALLHKEELRMGKHHARFESLNLNLKS